MPTLNSRTRLLLALFLAALCTPIIILIWGAIRNGITLEHGYVDALRGEVSGFVVYGIAAEAAAFILGLPAVFLYRRLHFTSWPLYAVGGALISLIVSMVLALAGTLYFLTGQPNKIHAWTDAAPLFVMCGAVSALAFRSMHRPESV